MLVGFKQRFVEKIQKGSKVFTMRDKPKRMPKIGETMFMYTALRTKYCQKISDKEKLRSIQKAKVVIKRRWTSDTDFCVHITVSIGASVFRSDSHYNTMNEFVRFDGFEDEKDFASYWLGDKPTTKKSSRNVKNRITATKYMFHWTDLKY